jgi:hypothetical protein
MPDRSRVRCNDALTEIKQKLIQRLVFAESLFHYKDRHESRDRCDELEPQVKLRREFENGFAYICDVERSGKTVTASALQACRSFNLLWLAANEGIRPDIKAYAEDVLQLLLQGVKGQKTWHDVEAKVTKMVIWQMYTTVNGVQQYTYRACTEMQNVAQP